MGASEGVAVDLVVPGRSDARVRTWWNPPRGPVRGWAWVQHGFARSARRLGGLGALLAEHGIATVRPELASLRPRHSMHDRVFLTSLTLAVAHAVDVGVVRRAGVETGADWIGVGHSAGSAVVVHAAAVLGSHGSPASGLVLLDPVDTVGRLLHSALPALGVGGRGEGNGGEAMPVSIAAFALRPSRCNRHGAASEWIAELPGAAVVRRDDLSHPDPERIPAQLRADAVPPPDRVAALACGRPGDAEAVVSLGRAGLEASLGMLAGPGHAVG